MNAQPAVEHLRQQIEYASSNVVYWLWHAEKKLDGYALTAADILKLTESARFAYSCAEVIEAVAT